MENKERKVCGFGDCFDPIGHCQQLLFSSFAQMSDSWHVPWRSSGLNEQDVPRKFTALVQRAHGKGTGGLDGCDRGGGWPAGLNWFRHSACLRN